MDRSFASHHHQHDPLIEEEYFPIDWNPFTLLDKIPAGPLHDSIPDTHSIDRSIDGVILSRGGNGGEGIIIIKDSTKCS